MGRNPENKPNMESETKEKNREGMSSQTSAASTVATAGGHGGDHGSLLRVASDQQPSKSNDVLIPPAGSSTVREMASPFTSTLLKKGNTTEEMPQRVPSSVADKGKMAVLEWHAEALVKFVSKRHNVHGEIKKISAKIRDLCLEMAQEYEAKTQAVKPKAVQVEQEVQTSPPPALSFAEMLSRACPTPKRSRDDERVSPTKQANPKRRKKKNNNDAPKTSESSTTVAIQNAESNWTKVKPRARKRAKREKPDALVIHGGEEKFADILKKVKNEPRLEELGNNVRSIRKTVKGDLLLELNKSCDPNISQYHGAIVETLGKGVEVRQLTQEMLIELKDLDEITTKEEVYDAITKQCESLKTFPLTVIRSLRMSYGGTQTALISLPMQAARKLLDAGKIRVGWTSCRIREKISPTQCYKCMHFGHIAQTCKSNDNWAKRCYKCGAEGHVARACDGLPSCTLCKDKNMENTKHPTGSRVCPSYQTAVKHIRKW